MTKNLESVNARNWMVDFEKSSSWSACTLVASTWKVERSAWGGLFFLPFRYFARETTTSTPGHITITKSSNGPSTRVPWVMLITSFGSHVFFARVRVVCCSGYCGTVSPLHASEIGCANSGTTVGLSSGNDFVVQSLKFSPRSRWFASLSTILSSWCVVSESANPWCGQHGG